MSNYLVILSALFGGFFYFLPTSGATYPNTFGSHPCIDEIPEILGDVNISQGSEPLCEGIFDDVNFALLSFIQLGDRRFLQGGGTALLNFRQSDYGPRSENQLNVVLEPRTNELWDVRFFDAREPDEVFDKSGPYNWMVWGRQQVPVRDLPRGVALADSSMRVFKCAFEVGAGCSTFYETNTCESYVYPQYVDDEVYDLLESRAKPILRVSAKTKDDAEAMLANYSEINLLARSIVNRLLEISCQK